MELTIEQKLRIANQLHHDFHVALEQLGLQADDEYQYNLAKRREQQGEVKPFDIYSFARQLGIIAPEEVESVTLEGYGTFRRTNDGWYAGMYYYGKTTNIWYLCEQASKAQANNKPPS